MSGNKKFYGRIFFIVYGFTTLNRVPFTKLRRFSTAVSMRRWRLSAGAQEMWGVIMQFGASNSGLSARIGSVDTTSRPAAATLPDFRASVRSCSTIRGPAAVVEDDNAILHFADGIFVDDTLGGREQRAVQGDDIGGGQQGVQICIFSNAAAGIRWMFIISQYLHAKRSGNSPGSLTNPSKTNDSDGLIFEFNKRIIPEAPVRARIPSASMYGFIMMPDVMADFQKETDGKLTNRSGTISRNIADGNAKFFCCPCVYNIIAGCEYTDKFQCTCGLF